MILISPSLLLSLPKAARGYLWTILWVNSKPTLWAFLALIFQIRRRCLTLWNVSPSGTNITIRKTSLAAFQRWPTLPKCIELRTMVPHHRQAQACTIRKPAQPDERQPNARYPRCELCRVSQTSRRWRQMTAYAGLHKPLPKPGTIGAWSKTVHRPNARYPRCELRAQVTDLETMVPGDSVRRLAWRAAAEAWDERSLNRGRHGAVRPVHRGTDQQPRAVWHGETNGAWRLQLGLTGCQSVTQLLNDHFRFLRVKAAGAGVQSTFCKRATIFPSHIGTTTLSSLISSKTAPSPNSSLSLLKKYLQHTQRRKQSVQRTEQSRPTLVFTVHHRYHDVTLGFSNRHCLTPQHTVTL